MRGPGYEDKSIIFTQVNYTASKKKTINKYLRNKASLYRALSF